MYSFYMLKNGSEYVKVTPIYGEDAKISVTRTQGEVFCRYDFDGNLTFTGKDYYLFLDGIVDTFTFIIEWSDEVETTEIIRADFTLADMDIDTDNRIAKVNLKGKDQYEEFLNKYDTEYDIVKLAPPRKNVNLYKRAFLQVFVLGDNKLTNILGDFEYEAVATNGAEEKTKSEIEAMGFSALNNTYQMNVKFLKSYATIANGKYRGSYGTDGVREIVQYEDASGNPSDAYKFRNVLFGSDKYELYNKDNTKFNPDFEVYFVMPNYPAQRTAELIIEGGIGPKPDGTVTPITRDVFARIILDNPRYGTSKFKSDDIWQSNLNYRYYTKLNQEQIKFFSRRIVLSDEMTTEPNEWQSDGKGNYFVQPSPTPYTKPLERVIAIGWSQWIPYSIWFVNGILVAKELGKYDEEWTLQDAYSIQDCIKILLKQIDPNIDFVSEFLNNVGLGADFNPILGRDNILNLYITPVTNIKKTYYEQAAQKGKITLKQILDMLKTCFNCYWYLEKRVTGWYLRVEHIEWFKNGGDYFYKKIYKDLSNLKVNLSGKSWIKDQGKVTFDLSNVKSRIAYKWGDKTSELFNGYPIVFNSNISKNKESDSIEVANFVADLDIIQSSPESVSDDIFVVLGTDENNDIYKQTIGYYDNTGALSGDYPQFIPQNSMLSFLFLEQKFLNYNVPFYYYGINQYEGLQDINKKNAKFIGKSDSATVKQRIIVPFTIIKPDLCAELFVTKVLFSNGAGGEIRSIEMNISSQSAEIELGFEWNY